MSITDSASGVLTKRVGPLPVAGWAAIGVGVIVVVKLLGGKSSGSSTVTVPDAFSGDAGSGGTTTTTGTTPVGTGTTAGAPAHYKLSLTSRTALYTTLGKLFGYGESGTYDATIVKVGTKSYYRIKRAGVWRLIPVGTKSVSVSQVK